MVTTMAWEEFESRVLKLYEPPAGTKAAWRKVRQVCRELAESGVQSTTDLTPESIARWINHFPERKAATTQGLIGYISPVCTYAVYTRVLDRNPLEFRRYWMRENPLPDSWDREEEESEKHLPAHLIERVLAQWPEAVFLALSVSDAAEDVIAVIRAGARGYVTKTITGPELVAAIDRVASGDAVFSPRLAGFVLDAFSGQAPAASDPELDLLTPREQDVMRLIARGYTYREAAANLHLSVKTVETHVSAVLRKLQLSNRKELTTWAATRRLL